MKIASLLPSATELCCALGLQDQLVAISHECDFPSGLDHIPRITGSIIPHGLTQKEIDALKASLKRALGRDIEIRTDVDPAVLGGLIVQVGSRMFDSSLRTKLDGLRTAMKEA